jgi:hypothetical protein
VSVARDSRLTFVEPVPAAEELAHAAHYARQRHRQQE